MNRDRTERPVQRFSDAYLKRCRELSPADIVRFLEDFRMVFGAASTRSQLISIRVPEPLLAAFKSQARLRGIPYQTQIKALMRDWLADSEQTAPTVRHTASDQPLPPVQPRRGAPVQSPEGGEPARGVAKPQAAADDGIERSN